MSEWASYSLSDFLLFSPETYYRLIALYNQWLWPTQILAIFATAVLIRSSASPRHRANGSFLLLAAGWAASGILFHGLRYATINWAAPWFAGGFLVQALLLALFATRLHRPHHNTGATGAAGFLLLGCGLLAYPLLPLMTGRSLWQAEIFLLAPDPTVIVTLGLLVLHEGRVRWWLAPLPLLWSAVGGATLVAMESPTAFLLPLAGLLAVLAMLRGHRPFGA